MKKIITSLIVSALSVGSLYGKYSDANTDYTNAKVDFSTKIDALDSLQAINGIICFTQHLRPDLMVNKGNYSALIDSKLCAKNKSTDQKTKNDYVIANVTRKSNTSSQIMNMWIPKDNVKVRMEVTKEVSDADPFGQFNITWQAFNTNEIPEGKGEIKTISVDGGKIGLTLFVDMNQIKSSVSIAKSPDSSKGIALTQTVFEEKGTTETFALAWEDNLVKAQKHFGEGSSLASFTENQDEKTCKNKTELTTKSVSSYGVYKKDDGKLLTLNTGFPFEANKDGKIIQGYIGHWGLWIEGDDIEGKSLDAIKNSIKKVNYTDNTKTDITISKDDNGNYTAKYTNGEVISFEQPIALKHKDYNLRYGGNGNLWDAGGKNVILLDGELLKNGENNYVVKALQGVNELRATRPAACDELVLKDPAEPLPQRISNNAVFNEDNTPDRPEKVSIINGKLQK